MSDRKRSGMSAFAIRKQKEAETGSSLSVPQRPPKPTPATPSSAIKRVVKKIRTSARKLSRSQLKKCESGKSIATGSEWDITLKPIKRTVSSPGTFGSGKKKSLGGDASPLTTPPLPPRRHQSLKIKQTEMNGSGGILKPNSSRRSLQRAVSGNGVVPERPIKRRKLDEDETEENTSKSPEPKTDRLGASEEMDEVDGGSGMIFDSKQEGAKLFDALIHPFPREKFFSELWEKKPLLLKRHMPDYNQGWFSTAELDKILRNHHIKFTENLDVTTYFNGKRETHNPEGRAYASVVWDYYQNGCSVRLMNPQTYSKNVWKFLALLQEFFGCFVGANMYLTPPGTQGFAPHYDDIEAFILQLEGKKRWRLYNPRSENETLPRFSSGNFSQEEIGKQVLDTELEAGDLLYFPRGVIHQGVTCEDTHSLHITVSCYQKNSYGDLLEKIVPRALQIAMEEDVEFRQGLPLNYLSYMGVANSDMDSPERQAFLRKIEQLMRKLATYAPVDASVDQMAKQFMHDAMPPVVSTEEKKRTIFANGEHWDQKSNCVRGRVELEPDTEIKLLRANILRLVTGENVAIYHVMENSRTYHEEEPKCIEVEFESAEAIEALIHAYPNYIPVDQLPMANVQDQVALASMLYDKGLVMTKEPLEPLSDESESEGDQQVLKGTSL